MAEAGYPDGEGFPELKILCMQLQIKNAEILQELLIKNLGIKTQSTPVDSKLFTHQVMQMGRRLRASHDIP